MEKIYRTNVTTYSIDSFFYSKKGGSSLDLSSIFNYVKNNIDFLIVEYDIEIFPALFIKDKSLRREDRSYPTCIIFHTGSICILGVKKYPQFENCYVMQNLINFLCKKFNKKQL